MSDKKIQQLAKQIQALEKIKTELAQQKLKDISEFMFNIGLIEVDRDLLMGALVDAKRRLLNLSTDEKSAMQKEGKKYSKSLRQKAS